MTKRFLGGTCAAAILITLSATSSQAMEVGEGLTQVCMGPQGSMANVQGVAMGSEMAYGQGMSYDQGMGGPSSMRAAASIWTAVWDVVRNIGQAIVGAFSGRGGRTEENARIAGTALGAIADGARGAPNPFEAVSDYGPADGTGENLGTAGVGAVDEAGQGDRRDDGLSLEEDSLGDAD